MGIYIALVILVGSIITGMAVHHFYVAEPRKRRAEAKSKLANRRKWEALHRKWEALHKALQESPEDPHVQSDFRIFAKDVRQYRENGLHLFS